MAANNGRRKSLRNLMGLEPDLPGMVDGDSHQSNDTDIALRNAKALSDGLRSTGSGEEGQAKQVSSRTSNFSTKGPDRRGSFRTQLKIEEDAAQGMFGVDRQSSRELLLTGNRFSRRPSRSTGADQISGILPAEYANGANLSNITEQSLLTGRTSDGADTSMRIGNTESLLSTQGFSPVQEEGKALETDKGKSGLRPPGSVSPQRRRSTIIDVASAGARKLKNMAKLKSVVRVIGLAKRMQKVQNDGTETDPSSGPKRSTSKNGMFGSLKSMKKMKKSRKELSNSISTRRINTTTKTQNNNEKNAKVQKEKIVAKKHENLVDQLKLRKKTHAENDIQTSMSKLSKEKIQQFDDTKICGFLKVQHPTSLLIRNWDLLIAVLVMSQVFIVPFQIAGFPGWEGDTSSGQEKESLIVGIDAIFFADIFVQFNIAIEKGEQGYYGDTNELITDRHEIAWTYLSGWFMIDLLAISPLFIYIAAELGGVTNNADTTNMLKLVKAARIPRLFRLLRIFRVMRTLNMKSKLMQWYMYSRYSYIFNLIYVIFTFIVLVHIYACIWFITSENNIAQRFSLKTGTINQLGVIDGVYDESYNDLYFLDSNNETSFRMVNYWQAFHQAVLIINGESMDNETETELFISSLLMIVGAIVMAVTFGEVSMHITNFYASTNMFQKKMTDLYESMIALNLPQNLQERIHLFYKYVWDEHHSIDGRPAILTFVPELSTNLAKEIYLYLYSDMITKVPMFHNRPADVIQHLVLAVQTLIYMPKDYVIVKGEFGQEMFFIQSGKCDVIIEISKKVANSASKDKNKLKKRLHKWGKKIREVSVKEIRSKRDKPKGPHKGEEASDESKMMSMNSSGRMSINGSVYKVVEKAVKELEAGSYFGEIALITDSRRTASIRSRTFTELLVLSRDDFNRITENNHEDREEMKNQIKRRYNQDKNVKDVLEEKSKRRISEAERKESELKEEEEKLMQRKSNRTSFLELHKGIDSKGGLGGGNVGGQINADLFEIRTQMRTMGTQLSNVAAIVEKLSDRQERRDRKEERRRKRIRNWKKAKVEEMARRNLEEEEEDEDEGVGDLGFEEVGNRIKRDISHDLDYVGRSISTFVDTDESSEESSSDAGSGGPKAKEEDEVTKARIKREEKKREEARQMALQRDSVRDAARQKEMERIRQKKEAKKGDIKKQGNKGDVEGSSSDEDSVRELSSSYQPKIATPSEKKIETVLNKSKLGYGGGRFKEGGE
ncbi:hypothetical protein TrCOL_g5596 [Triparma columacea]|uniref:Cyclic nucleotide-binding domain-containing protein n=1 Tax=Triparma columacea TaxID=722753 RepID=A0A9W7GG84_9STRA|nr:hypothetical protein TrCOL_g5596 [Triparma columacea]